MGIFIGPTQCNKRKITGSVACHSDGHGKDNMKTLLRFFAWFSIEWLQVRDILECLGHSVSWENGKVYVDGIRICTREFYLSYDWHYYARYRDIRKALKNSDIIL